MALFWVWWHVRLLGSVILLEIFLGADFPNQCVKNTTQRISQHSPSSNWHQFANDEDRWVTRKAKDNESQHHLVAQFGCCTCANSSVYVHVDGELKAQCQCSELGLASRGIKYALVQAVNLCKAPSIEFRMFSFFSDRHQTSDSWNN